jgi:hypothetical protein
MHGIRWNERFQIKFCLEVLISGRSKVTLPCSLLGSFLSDIIYASGAWHDIVSLKKESLELLLLEGLRL